MTSRTDRDVERRLRLREREERRGRLGDERRRADRTRRADRLRLRERRRHTGERVRLRRVRGEPDFDLDLFRFLSVDFLTSSSLLSSLLSSFV